MHAARSEARRWRSGGSERGHHACTPQGVRRGDGGVVAVNEVMASACHKDGGSEMEDGNRHGREHCNEAIPRAVLRRSRVLQLSSHMGLIRWDSNTWIQEPR
jgi:hypothetical protein